jgi:hypothetical protein
MKSIYIIAPYTPHQYPVGSEDYIYYQNQYIENANEMGKKIFLAGCMPIIPHNMFRSWEMDPRFKDISHKKWSEMTEAVMIKCDGIFLMPGWIDHKGCVSEFKKWGGRYESQNVFYNLEELKNFTPPNDKRVSSDKVPWHW